MVERYLLFDSGCGRCTKLAYEIEQESEGWLAARSLRDPAIRVLLEQARPDWRWQPTLLEIENGKVRVATGIALTAKIVKGLGVRRAMRVAKLVQQATPELNRASDDGRRPSLYWDCLP